MEEEYLRGLIQKYVTGTATDAEKAELMEWYQEWAGSASVLPYKDSKEEDEARERILFQLQQQIASQPKQGYKIAASYIKYAAAAIILFIASFVIYRFKVPKQAGENLTVVYTNAGEHKIVKLPDGTTIWLSSKSKLRYPSVFNGHTREITFEGEAFFNVAKDKKHPFIVHTGTTNTRVLGTTFNITALTGKPDITVALITGHVAFTGGKEALMLMPGHEIIFNKRQKTTEMKVIPNPDDVVNRKNGDYEYKNVRVADVIADVNLNFNTNFTVEGKVSDCPFFGRLKPGETPAVFLKKLCIVVNAELTQSNGSYVIKGGGCN